MCYAHAVIFHILKESFKSYTASEAKVVYQVIIFCLPVTQIGMTMG